jgi:hypothetical protein
MTLSNIKNHYPANQTGIGSGSSAFYYAGQILLSGTFLTKAGEN